tara:strand:+ start:2378 stop:3370 length:993 start_codon:yes stop_codon:yes gene_type:complete
MKKTILIVLIINTIFILAFGKLEMKNLYDPKIIISAFKKVFKTKSSPKQKFNDKERFFKKTITNNQVTVNEITRSKYSEIKYNQFVNESDENFILNIFDGNQNQNFIFYNPADTEFPKNLLDLFSLLVIHGALHNDLLFDEKLETIKNEPLILTCGPGSHFFNKLLEKYNVKSRVVKTLTFDDWNSYDNGHVLLEVFSEKMDKWFLYDIDGQKVFKKNGNRLSLIEIQSFSMEEIEIKSISNQPNIDYGSFNKYSSIMEDINFNPKKWYKRVFQKFSIFDQKSKKYIFLTDYDNGSIKNRKKSEEDCKIIKKYNENHLCLSYELFIEKFY